MQGSQSKVLLSFALKLSLGEAQHFGHFPDFKSGLLGKIQELVCILSAQTNHTY